MIVHARCDLIVDLDIPVLDAQGNSLIAEARAAFVQGKNNAVKLYSEGGISICAAQAPGEPSYRIRIHLSPEDTGKFRGGPNQMVDFQLYVLPQHDVDGQMVAESEPLGSEVIAIPVGRSLEEAIIKLGGEYVEDPLTH